MVGPYDIYIEMSGRLTDTSLWLQSKNGSSAALEHTDTRSCCSAQTHTPLLNLLMSVEAEAQLHNETERNGVAIYTLMFGWNRALFAKNTF